MWHSEHGPKQIKYNYNPYFNFNYAKLILIKFTMFSLPFPTKIETKNVVMQDALIERYVLTMALI